MHFQKEERLWSFYQALFIGATMVAVFQIINIVVSVEHFLPGFLKGISSGNLVGNWNDFALLFGLIILLCIATIELLKTKGLFMAMQYFLLISGVFFLIIVNVPLVWILVGLFSIIIFVYTISIQQARIREDEAAHEKKKFPFVSLVMIFICLIFLIGNNSIGNLISRNLSVYNVDVHPGASTTLQIAYKAIRHNPLFGTGPNTFVMDWALWQPKEVAQSVFWNVDFVNGYSSLMTFVVTTGLLGIFAWLLFLYAVIKKIITSIQKVLHAHVSNYFTMSTLIVTIYSWATIIFYTPNFTMFACAFVSSGMLVALLVMNQSVHVREFSFLHDPRASFFSILILMILMIVTLSTTYVYAEKFASLIYFSKGQVSTNTIESLAQSERHLSNALLLDQNDVYYRTLSQVYLADIGIIINDKTRSADSLKPDVERLISLAESSAKSAISQNPKQYLNYMNLGNLYSSLVPLAVRSSYESAVVAYEKARALAPNNPSILLSRASLEVAHKNNDEAKKFIDQALLLKSDYTDALFLLAQINISEGNMSEAIKQAEKASIVAPNDSTVFFKLGLLKYNNADYQGSINAFQQALKLNSQYLDAAFLLGQSYKKAGRIDEARDMFNALTKRLPNNQDVKDALSSLSQTFTAPVPTTPSPTKTPTKPAKTTGGQ